VRGTDERTLQVTLTDPDQNDPDQNDPDQNA
jgi:hypothetical protein